MEFISMQIKKIPNSTRTDYNVYISRTAKNTATGKRECKAIRSLGKFSELKKKYGDELDAFLLKEKEKAEKEFEECKKIFTLSITPGSIINMRKKDAPAQVDNLRNIGAYVILKQYKRLGIDIFMTNRSRNRDSKYKLNPIFRLLVVDRIISPGSKLHAHGNRDHYFFSSDFPERELYRSLEDIASLKQPLLEKMNSAIAGLYPRDTSLLYYDVTNYYFEIDEEEGKKKVGCSKEHRKTPIIQLGLFMDSNGFPVSYETFSGNNPDVTTFVPAMKDMRRKFDMKNTIYVADKGMMSSDNIKHIVVNHDGYIISDSVRRSSEDFLKDYVLDEAGYEYTEDLEDGGITFKCKELTVPQKRKLTTDSGKKTTFSFNERIIIFWSRKYAEKARYERAEAVKKAKESLNNPGSKVNNSYGSNKYKKADIFNKDTGEADTSEKVYAMSIDEKRIEEESRYDGYYIIRSNVYGLEEGEAPMKTASCFDPMTLSVKINRKADKYDIIDMYRGLWKIEETFRMSKTTGIKTRPVFVRKEDSIEAHFLTCFTAMLLLRMIEKDTGLCYEQIISALQNANYVKLNNSLYKILYYDQTMDKIGLKTGVPLNYEYLTPALIKEIAGK